MNTLVGRNLTSNLLSSSRQTVKTPIVPRMWTPKRTIIQDGPGAPPIKRIPAQTVTLDTGKQIPNVRHPYLHMREKKDIATGNPWWLTEQQQQEVRERIDNFEPKEVVDPLATPIEQAVYALDRSSREPIELSRHVFGLPVRVDIIHRSVRRYQFSTRRGTHSELRRDEVSGGGKKPRPQKGQGVSRQGSIRSPQWRGGGVVFPRKPHDYSIDLQSKVETLALKMTLSSKMESGHFVVVENFDGLSGKTKELVTIMEQWGWKKPLYVTDGEIPVALSRSAGSTEGDVSLQTEVIPHKLLVHDFVVFDRASVKALQDRILQLE